MWNRSAFDKWNKSVFFMMSLMIFFVSFRLRLSRVEEISVYRVINEIVYLLVRYLSPFDSRQLIESPIISFIQSSHWLIMSIVKDFFWCFAIHKRIIFLLIITCMGPSLGNILSLFLVFWSNQLMFLIRFHNFFGIYFKHLTYATTYLNK